MMLWWKWELDAEREEEIVVRVHRSAPAQPATYLYWSASRSISISLICSHIQLCFAPSWKTTCFSRSIQELQLRDDAHISAATTWKKYIMLGNLRLHTGKKCACFKYTVHFSLSKWLKSLGWMCYSLCYNISIWGEDECVPSLSPHTPPPPLFLPPPAESCCLGGKTWLQRHTNPGDTVKKAAVLSVWVFFFFLRVWWIAYTYRTVVQEIHPVSNYSQGYTEREPPLS